MFGLEVGDRVKVSFGLTGAVTKTGTVETFSSSCPYIAQVVVRDDKSGKRMSCNPERVAKL